MSGYDTITDAAHDSFIQAQQDRLDRNYKPPGPKVWPNGVPKTYRKGTGYVYFLLAKENLVQPMMKIGYSMRGRETRLRACQTGSPVKLELAATIYGTRFDEQALHRRFEYLRAHGEWFAFSGELQDYVEGLA